MNTCKNKKCFIKNTTLKKNVILKSCIALLQPDKSIKNNHVNGVVEFIQKSKYLLIKYKIENLEDGLHGFHIHKCGDLTKGCSSACEHFNPFNKNHGSLNSKDSHAGDLGNIKSIKKLSQGIIRTNKVSLINEKTNIIGRMIIVHKDKDDLGKGNNEASLKTGNAGIRLACGVIGIKN
tara:strand:+ start:77 stop:610 length:534 start_codon:yes stop_codon:yes gene_type:complete